MLRGLPRLSETDTSTASEFEFSVGENIAPWLRNIAAVSMGRKKGWRAAKNDPFKNLFAWNKEELLYDAPLYSMFEKSENRRVPILSTKNPYLLSGRFI